MDRVIIYIIFGSYNTLLVLNVLNLKGIRKYSSDGSLYGSNADSLILQVTVRRKKMRSVYSHRS